MTQQVLTGRRQRQHDRGKQPDRVRNRVQPLKAAEVDQLVATGVGRDAALSKMGHHNGCLMSCA